MKKALITNDDGYKAPGIRALIKELEKGYDITAVAPKAEQSWVSKSLSRRRDLTLEEAHYQEFKGYTVDGTPADCAQIGIYEVLERLPDFVVSGINHGSNEGYAHTLNSGTIGAALEAALQGVPAFAVSLHNSKYSKTIDDFANVATIAKQIIDKVMAHGFPLSVQVISINMPYGVQLDAHWAITEAHTSRGDRLFKKVGEKLQHQGGGLVIENPDNGTDSLALEKGYVSINPITVQLSSSTGKSELAKQLDTPILDQS